MGEHFVMYTKWCHKCGEAVNFSISQLIFFTTVHYEWANTAMYTKWCHKCVRVRVCVCVRAFMLYALNFDNMYL